MALQRGKARFRSAVRDDCSSRRLERRKIRGPLERTQTLFEGHQKFLAQ